MRLDEAMQQRGPDDAIENAAGDDRLTVEPDYGYSGGFRFRMEHTRHGQPIAAHAYEQYSLRPELTHEEIGRYADANGFPRDGWRLIPVRARRPGAP